MQEPTEELTEELTEKLIDKSASVNDEPTALAGKNTKAGSRLIFVGGAPRSGTTLLQKMLDSHPDICGGPEFIHLRHILALRNQLNQSVEKGWIDLICSKEQVDASLVTLTENLLLPAADQQNAHFYSEKTPDNVLFFPQLIDLFPQARFIHLVRDPRATIASLLAVGKRAEVKKVATSPWTSSFQGALSHVKQYLEAGLAASQQAPDKILTILYENSVSSPELETKKICDFLQIEWSSQMVTPSRKQRTGKKMTTIEQDNVWYGTKASGQDPTAQFLNDWKTTLSARQKASINHVFNDNAHLNKFPYQFHDPDITGVNRAWGKAYSRLFRAADASPLLHKGLSVLTASTYYRKEKLKNMLGRRARE